MSHFRNSQCSHDIKKIWCRNYVARTRLSRKSLSSVKRIKCRVNENKRNFLEIQCGREKSNLWDGEYQLSDGGKGKKKGRTVPFMHCSNEANKTGRFWKRPQNVVGCLDVGLPQHFKVLVQRLHAALLQLFSCHHLNLAFFLTDSYVAGAYCNFRNKTWRNELEIYNLQNKKLYFSKWRSVFAKREYSA